MKKCNNMFIALGMSAFCSFSIAVSAEHARFNATTEILHIPVVELLPPLSGFYSVDLNLTGNDYSFKLDTNSVTVAVSTPELVYTTLSFNEMEQMLDDLNLQHEQKTSATTGTTYISVTLESITARIYLYDCTVIGTSETCKNLEFLAGFSMSSPPSLSDINIWNTDYRYVTAYLNIDGNPRLSMSLDIEHGVTAESIKNSVLKFQQFLTMYATNIGFRSTVTRNSVLPQNLERQFDNDIPLN